MDKFEKIEAVSKQMAEYNDCSVKAVALACDVPYKVAHKALENQGRKKRNGARVGDMQEAIKKLGFKTAPVAYNAKTAITLERDPLLTKGHYIALMKRHVAAVVNGSVQDWTSGRRNRVKRVWVVVPTASRTERAKLAKQIFEN